MAFRHFAVVATLAAVFLPAATLADDLPTPKAGLWEIRFIGGGPQTAPDGYKQCMDGKIDLEGLIKRTGGICSMTWKRVAADRIETETQCKMGEMSAEGRGVVTGDFTSLIRVESKTKISMEGLPAGIVKMAMPNDEQSMVMEARWVGPCEPGQKPGDIVMPDGRVMNMPNPSPAMPQ